MSALAPNSDAVAGIAAAKFLISEQSIELSIFHLKKARSLERIVKPC
jgi:hypothetical protein